MYNVHLTLKSRNSKTGPMPVSTTTATTCPAACLLATNGCYAQSGPLAIHWGKVTAGIAGMPWLNFVKAIAALPAGILWRHNQAGDLPGQKNRIDRKALRALVKSNKGKRGFTYTHYPMDIKGNKAAIVEANTQGFTINLSANNAAHADTLAELGIGPVVVVLPVDQMTNTATPAGRPIVVCPAVTRDDIACTDCGACAVPHRRNIIGFPAHGTNQRKASAIASA